MRISIYVVQYNKPEFMKLQYNLIKRYCKDDYEYIIVNNGKNEDYVKEFHDFCITNNIREIQTFQDRISNTQDHSRALKYLFDKFLSLDKSDFRVVMDHDIFPFADFSIADIMGDYEIGGLKLGYYPFYISSFIIIFNKNVNLYNVPVNIFAEQDATMWTYGIASKYRIKWLNHTTQGYREIYYIFKDIPDIIKEYKKLNNKNITFQIIESNLLHYWQGSEWNNHSNEFHKKKLDFIKYLIDNIEVEKIRLDNNVFYTEAIIHEWLNPTNYPLNKIDENEYI